MDVVRPVAIRLGRVRAIVGWLISGVSIALVSVGVALTIRDDTSVLADDVALGAVVSVGSALLAGFVLTRHPASPIGWLFGLGALSRGVAVAAVGWSRHALATHPGSLPGGGLASWLQAWSVLPGIATVPLLVVLFPDGRLPDRRWRVVPALSGVALVLLCVVAPIGMWRYRGTRLLPDAPVPNTTDAHVVSALMVVGFAAVVIAIVVALSALVGHARRSVGRVRQQVKWFAYGAACGLVLNLAGALPDLAWIRLFGAAAVLTGIGLGVFRYRLYDIDRLINRTLVYGTVTLALVGVFAALDVTLARIVGRESVVVAATSAFLVALLMRPARDRAQQLVDRLFARRTYDAVGNLRALGQQVGQQPVEPDTVVAALRRALGDAGAQVYFQGRHPDSVVDSQGHRVDEIPVGADQVADTITRDEEKIAVLVHAPGDPELLRAVVRAAAAVLEHARLQAELLVQLAEVRASRARLVAAGDVERRRIERDLHDGAQQRLVGLALHLQTARRRAAHPPEVAELLAFTVDQLNAGVEDIRALVHGILPPALASSGLPAALQELARPGVVVVDCRIADRLDPGIAATGWFVACEGVANATKHAAGQQIRVQAGTHGGWLTVRVGDDGSGAADPDGDGLRSLADRVEAHGGRLTIDSPPGAGTRLVATLPCE